MWCILCPVYNHKFYKCIHNKFTKLGLYSVIRWHILCVLLSLYGKMTQHWHNKSEIFSLLHFSRCHSSESTVSYILMLLLSFLQWKKEEKHSSLLTCHRATTGLSPSPRFLSSSWGNSQQETIPVINLWVSFKYRPVCCSGVHKIMASASKKTHSCGTYHGV